RRQPARHCPYPGSRVVAFPVNRPVRGPERRLGSAQRGLGRRTCLNMWYYQRQGELSALSSPAPPPRRGSPSWSLGFSHFLEPFTPTARVGWRPSLTACRTRRASAVQNWVAWGSFTRRVGGGTLAVANVPRADP